MQIVITGVTGFRNRGVEALVRPIVSQTLARFPGAKLRILSDSPDYDGLRIEQKGVSFLRDQFSELGRSRIARWKSVASRYVQRAAPSFRRLSDEIANASLVLATGGDVFSSDYGAIQRHLAPLRVAIRSHTPFVLLAQSIGPFKKTSEVERFLEVARHAALITVRERISYEYLTGELGLAPSLVQLTADPAFLLEPCSADDAAQIHRFYGLDPSRATIALGISRGVESFTDCCKRGEHLQAWVRVVNLLIEELGANVLLVPHVQERSCANDDRILATNLARELGYGERLPAASSPVSSLAVASLDHSAAELKGIISQCDLVIAERMHAAIAGLSTATPTIAIGYSIKARGILETLFDSPDSRENLLVPIESFETDDSICGSIRWAWEHRTKITKELEDRLPAVRDLATKNFELITELVRSN